MLTVEKYARIRKAFRGGMSIREIARKFRHSRKTVRKVLKSNGQPNPYPKRATEQAPVLGPYHERIREILEDDKQQPVKQRHTASQIFRRISKEDKYKGGYDAVKRFVRNERISQGILATETFIPLERHPGERVECDFGKAYIDFPEGRRRVSILVMNWTWSNRPFAIAMPTERSEAILAGMVRGFEYFGCIPREVWWDNPKTVATSILTGRQRTLHPRYLALSSHYVFDPCFCMPAKGNEKGSAENRVKSTQKIWCTPIPQMRDMDELNGYLLKMCDAELEKKRDRSDLTIGQCFEQDRAASVPLPRHRFDPYVPAEASVDKYQLIRYDNVEYSVPLECLLQKVAVKVYFDRIDIACRGETVASHPRSYQPGDQRLNPIHYLRSLAKRPAALDKSSVYRNWALPPIFGEVRQQLEERHGGTTGRRHYIRILQLLADHPAERIARVLRFIDRPSQLDANHVTRCVARLAEDQPGIQEDLSNVPQALGTSVPVPDISKYNRLLLQGENTDEHTTMHDAARSELETTASADDPGRARETGSRGDRNRRQLCGVPAPSDRDGGCPTFGERGGIANPAGNVSRSQGTGRIRLLGNAEPRQAKGGRDVQGPVDYGSDELLYPGATWHRENAFGNFDGVGGLPGGTACAVLHGSLAGEQDGGSTAGPSARSVPAAVRPIGPAHLRRVGLLVIQPFECGVIVSSLCGSVRTPEPVDHQQSVAWRLGPSLPGRTHDGGLAGPLDASLRNIRAQRRKFSLSRVDKEDSEHQVTVENREDRQQGKALGKVTRSSEPHHLPGVPVAPGKN